MRERELPVSGTKSELIRRLERQDSPLTTERDMFLSFISIKRSLSVKDRSTAKGLSNGIFKEY